MPQLRAIIQSGDDGAASETCRVLCKNSNARAVVSAIGTAFISTPLPEAGSIFPLQNVNGPQSIRPAPICSLVLLHA
jgi:hypothetical protein